MILSRLIAQAANTLWGRDVRGASRQVRWGTFFLRLVVAVLRDMREGHLRLRAAALSYITLLSFAPLLALSFSVLKGLGAGGALEPFLMNLLTPLGKSREDVTARIVEFVTNVQVGVLGILGLGLLLYSVLKLMQEVELAFNDIWRVRRSRPLALRVRDYLSVLMLGPVLLLVSIAIPPVLNRLGGWAGLPALLQFAGDAVAWVLFAGAFSALYMFMPYTRVRAGPALTAGLATAVLWKILGRLFALFVAGSASYAAIYSAFAALVLFMIWVYVGWLVVLAGACACYYLQNPSNQRLGRDARPLSQRAREKLALAACAEVGRAFYASAPPPDADALSASLSLSAAAISAVLDDLAETGFIVPAGGGFIPGRPFDTTRTDDMLEALRAVGEDSGVRYGDIRAPDAVSGTLKQLSQGSEKA